MKRQWLIIPSYEELEQSAALAEQYGAAFEYNDFCDPSVYEEEEEVKKRIAAYKALKRDRSRDTLHGAFLDMAFASTDSHIKEYCVGRIVQSASIAAELGIRGIVLHTGLIAELDLNYYVEGWLAAAEELIRSLAKQFPAVEFYMENTFEQHPGILCRLAERLKDVEQFGLCLDYAHAVLTKTPAEVWVKELTPYIKHCHLNDNDLRSDLHQVPGTGKIDYKEYERLLDRYQIHTPVLLELKGLEHQKKALEYMTVL